MEQNIESLRSVVLNIQCNYTKEQLAINIEDFAVHYKKTMRYNDHPI